ncbi:MAG: tRNA pseudouridine(38-40) synthase TruA [Bacteroidaceae bacterium]|nr:tRNA pseudouridine(38-40) synthase TruA [Bacteroidaceae bacterium]
MRYFIYLSYDGSGYCGWQIQPGSPSVQQTIENAFSLFMRQNIRVTGAGRTDTGVHARTMVAHFDLDNPADTLWMTSKLNCILPDDIAIQRIVPVAPSAHARFDATSRTYRYYVSLVKTPFAAKYSWQLSVKPDFELMNQAAKLLLDTSDFTSFSKLHTDTKTNNCRVIEADWEERGQGLWVFTITADRFLRNMVRAIVGTLLDVGRHKLTIADFTEIVNGLDRCLAGDSAPAHGLFLEGITYPEIIFNTTI